MCGKLRVWLVVLPQCSAARVVTVEGQPSVNSVISGSAQSIRNHSRLVHVQLDLSQPAAIRCNKTVFRDQVCKQRTWLVSQMKRKIRNTNTDSAVKYGIDKFSHDIESHEANVGYISQASDLSARMSHKDLWMIPKSRSEKQNASKAFDVRVCPSA